jgi:signal transduction histidine kinase
MQSRAAEQDVVLGCDLDHALPLARFDPDGIHRAVLNLVTNAIDAAAGAHDSDRDFNTHADNQPTDTSVGKVFVQTRFDPRQGWIIDVVDNGPGVPVSEREKIFSLFESSKGMRGTGLGLPVCAKIMQEHGGEIRYVDPGIERGSCFRLHLPLVATRSGDSATGETIS